MPLMLRYSHFGIQLCLFSSDCNCELNIRLEPVDMVFATTAFNLFSVIDQLVVYEFLAAFDIQSLGYEIITFFGRI